MKFLTYFRIAAAVMALCLSAGTWAQEKWPVRPIRILVPTAAGGSLDLFARLVGQKVGERLGQPFVVENRPGGGTTVAELCAVGCPAIIVPYPHHRDRQQLRNAEVLAKAGAAMIVEEPVLSIESMAELVTCLLSDPQRLETMGAAARRLQHGNAAAAILRDMGLAPSLPAVDGSVAAHTAQGMS